MFKRWMCCAAAWLFCTIVGSIPAGAHDLPLDRMMNGFVKIEPHQADFVVRVPLDLLLGVPFPLAGDHYNIAASRPAVETALKALGQRSRALGRQRSSRAFERRRPAGSALGSLVRRL